MNFGESNKLKLVFPNVIKIKRPEIKIYNTELDPFWVTGFITGEGSFYISINKTTHKMRPVFSIGLNVGDKFLLEKMNRFFNNIGSIYTTSSNNSAEIKIFKLVNISNLINPLESYPLQGFKLYNFKLWCEIIELLKIENLTHEILDKINNLKNKLNKWD